MLDPSKTPVRYDTIVTPTAQSILIMEAGEVRQVNAQTLGLALGGHELEWDDMAGPATENWITEDKAHQILNDSNHENADFIRKRLKVFFGGTT